MVDKVHMRRSYYDQSPILETMIGKHLVCVYRINGLWRVSVNFPTRDPHITRVNFAVGREFKYATTALLHGKSMIRRGLRHYYGR